MTKIICVCFGRRPFEGGVRVCRCDGIGLFCICFGDGIKKYWYFGVGHPFRHGFSDGKMDFQIYSVGVSGDLRRIFRC